MGFEWVLVGEEGGMNIGVKTEQPFKIHSVFATSNMRR